MQKKFVAAYFLVGVLGVVSVQAMFSADNGGEKKTPWLQHINRAAICVAAVNVPLQLTGYATPYAQTVLPFWVGGALGTIGGTAAKYVITPTLTTGWGLPFLAGAVLIWPITQGTFKLSHYFDVIKKEVPSYTMLKILGAGALLAGAGFLASRYSTPTGLKI